MNIVTQIFNYAEAKGWNSKQLAEHLGISEAVLSRIKTGERKPSFHLLRLIANKIPELRSCIGEYIKGLLTSKEES